jgi:hypothetical protein
MAMAEDKYEYRRKKLIELISLHYGGKDVNLSERLGIAPTYVSRMLYPEGKKGKKNIGEKMVEKIEDAHPGWFQNVYLRQLDYFFMGMTQEHQDDLLKFANYLYSIDNPKDKTANPFPDRVKLESIPNTAEVKAK